MGSCFSTLELNVENEKLKNIFLERFYVIQICVMFLHDHCCLIPHYFPNWKRRLFISIYYDLQDKFPDFTIVQFNSFAAVYYEYFLSHLDDIRNKEYINTARNIINGFKYMMTSNFTTDIETTENNKSITKIIIPITN
jgi:hypothetical protein